MARLSQEGRVMKVLTPLGQDVLLLETLQGTEAISEPFHFKLDLLWDPDTSAVKFENMIGQSVTVSLEMGENKYRFVNGVVQRFSEGSQVVGQRNVVKYVRYRAELVPKFELLKRVQRSRIFQQLSVPDILKKVLVGFDVGWEIEGTFEPRDYCAQYRESDFEFASRLMEEEGIYYFFLHTDGSHKMIVANTPQSHRDVHEPKRIEYGPTLQSHAPVGQIFTWEKTQELRSGKYTLWDHNFELTGKNLEAKATILETVQVGDTAHKLKAGGGDNFEIYDFPGDYAGRFDGVDPGGAKQPANLEKIFQDNKRTVGIRMQQEAAQSIRIHGDSDAMQLESGHKFGLTKHFTGDGDYVVTRVSHSATQAGSYETGTGESKYANIFEAIPYALPFRPEIIREVPSVYGTLTGTVVGPAGEEIFTDAYGRIKVQFPWDREGKNDSNSSCWVRVVTPWASTQWGTIHIPRIGMEVVIAFEHGNPNYPVCLGSVYNSNNMPPYTLPDNRTKSGIKSRSSLKANEQNYNELFFEDKKGEEKIYFHAEKDFHRVVENDDTLDVGFREGGKSPEKGDRTVTIHNNDQTVVGYKFGKGPEPEDGSQAVYIWNNQEVIVGNGETSAKDGSRLVNIWNNDELIVGNGKGVNKVGDQLVSIWNNQVVTIGKGEGSAADGSQDVAIYKDRTHTLKTGTDKLTISKGDQLVKIDLGKMGMEAMQKIEFKVGQSVLTIDQKGITMKGLMISIEGTVKSEFKGLMAELSGTAMCKVGGGITMIG